MDALPGTIGRYEVKAFIARGGMGTVYLATDPALQRPVAIKLLREASNEELRSRFAREARSAANLRHRNIVTIFDVGEHNGEPFIAMEYIQGETLTRLIAGDPPPSTIRRLQLVEDLCDGLSYAHKRGVVHRDIKPANVMVDADNTLKILDFGIARAAAEAGGTQAGLLLGTLNYMSPEQVTGGELDGRSDMFAVGAVLYEMFARRQAFPGSIETGVLNRILTAAPEPLNVLCPHLHPAVAPIVEQAMAKDPVNRFADLQQMRAAIAQVRVALEASAFEDDDTVPEAPTIITGQTPKSTRRPDREEFIRRRTQQIEDYVAAARKALNSGDTDTAIARCEEALILDPNEPRAFDLRERARRQRDETNARDLLARAHSHLKAGELTSASTCVREVLALMPGSSEAIELRRVIAEARLAQDRRRQQAAALDAVLTRARTSLERFDPQSAVTACDEALTIAPEHSEAHRLRARAEHLIAEFEQEQHERAVRETIAQAQQLVADGRLAEAIALLESFSPAESAISQLKAELLSESARRVEVQETITARSDTGLDEGAGPSSRGIDAPWDEDATQYSPRHDAAEWQDAGTLHPPSDHRGHSETEGELGPPTEFAHPPTVGEEDVTLAPLAKSTAPILTPDARREPRGIGGQATRTDRSWYSRTTLIVVAVMVAVVLVALYFLLRNPDTGGGRIASVVTSVPPTAITTVPPTVPDGGGPPQTPTPTTVPAVTTLPGRSGGISSPTSVGRGGGNPPNGVTTIRPATTPTTVPVKPGEETIRPDTTVPVTTVPPATTTVPVTVPATTPTSVPQPPQVADRELIEVVLKGYAKAFSERRVDGVIALFPSQNRAALTKAFSDVKTQEMKIDPINVTLLSPTAATAQCTITLSVDPRAGSAIRSTSSATFRMEKRDDRWVITQRQ